MPIPDPYPTLADDSLPTIEVNDYYVEEKYRLVTGYASIFARSMKTKWGSLVYLDLFAGPGRSKFKNSEEIIASSPLLVLQDQDKFDKYIFCEKLESFASALEQRVQTVAGNRKVDVVPGDCNQIVPTLLQKIPQHSPGHSVLSFCFLDPYRFNDLDFNTIRSLSKKRMDFLVLIPSGQEASRFEHELISEGKGRLDKFLGNNEWRERWELDKKKTGYKFENFVVREFTRAMQNEGYFDPGLSNMRAIKNEKKVVVYRLALYSKNELGRKFWSAINDAIYRQDDLFD